MKLPRTWEHYLAQIRAMREPIRHRPFDWSRDA
jgi:hypothetical protein